MKRTLLGHIFLFIAGLVFIACSKTKFLDTPPNRSLVVPQSLADLQGILDQDGVMNAAGYNNGGPVPFAGEASSDDYFLTDASYNSMLSVPFQHYYTWSDGLETDGAVTNWNSAFQTVLYANTALDEVKKMSRTSDNAVTYDRVMGGAIFFRAHAYYQLAQVYALPYGPSTLNSAGLPLRRSSDITENLYWATLTETYQFILTDLLQALPLLPKSPSLKTRPSQQAAYALLARTYLVMGNYERALSFADSCLSLPHQLSDFNQLDPSASFPFEFGSHHHPEVIFSCNMSGYNSNYPMSPFFALADSNLYRSFANSDLRKTLFFMPATDGQQFKGSYEGSGVFFAGIAIDEIYLIKAECLARLGEAEPALHTVNSLLVMRYQAGSYINYMGLSAEQTLSLILSERRKELLFRGLRWTDLRRYLSEDKGLTLLRNINGKLYSLKPSDARYTLPIPDAVKAFH
ncbi:SusD family protein [bacterium A37T11]|nr:SusD family protein [bacterium A37T11]